VTARGRPLAGRSSAVRCASSHPVEHGDDRTEPVPGVQVLGPGGRHSEPPQRCPVGGQLGPALDQIRARRDVAIGGGVRERRPGGVREHHGGPGPEVGPGLEVLSGAEVWSRAQFRASVRSGAEVEAGVWSGAEVWSSVRFEVEVEVGAWSGSLDLRLGFGVGMGLLWGNGLRGSGTGGPGIGKVLPVFGVRSIGGFPVRLGRARPLDGPSRLLAQTWPPAAQQLPSRLAGGGVARLGVVPAGGRPARSDRLVQQAG
jgi:hypothetical protein